MLACRVNFNVNCDGFQVSWGKYSLAMSWPQPRHEFVIDWEHRPACTPDPLGR